jgi:hypothetical protein
MDGGGKQPILAPEKMQLIEKLAARGVGIVHLHQIIDYPKTATDRILPLIGGVWVPGAGARGHWDGVFENFVDHPITRGVAPFKENDGFIYKLKFVEGMKGITPLLRTTPPKGTLKDTEDIVSWAYQRPEGGPLLRVHRLPPPRVVGPRVDAALRDQRHPLVGRPRGPGGGAPVAMDAEELKKNLDPVPARNKPVQWSRGQSLDYRTSPRRRPDIEPEGRLPQLRTFAPITRSPKPFRSPMLHTHRPRAGRLDVRRPNPMTTDSGSTSTSTTRLGCPNPHAAGRCRKA